MGDLQAHLHEYPVGKFQILLGKFEITPAIILKCSNSNHMSTVKISTFSKLIQQSRGKIDQRGLIDITVPEANVIKKEE